MLLDHDLPQRYALTMSRYHDDSTSASDPLSIRVNRQRLALAHPEGWLSRLLGLRRQAIEIIDEHMSLGDSRAAILLSLRPLRVAAYTDELDCAAVLEFDAAASSCLMRELSDLHEGQRLITVNTYAHGSTPISDLWNGPDSYHRYCNFFPVIANFYSSDTMALERRISEIPEAEWERCRACSTEYLERNAGRVRDGSPFRSAVPA